MKKIVIGLVAIIAILGGALLFLGRNSSLTLYKDAPTVSFKDIGNDVEGTNYYYFYKEDCDWCIKIKPDIAEFYYNKDEDVDFYLIDAANVAENADVWYQGDSKTFVRPIGQFQNYTDLQITGTPTLIEIKDGEVTQFLVGGVDVPEYLATL